MAKRLELVGAIHPVGYRVQSERGSTNGYAPYIGELVVDLEIKFQSAMQAISTLSSGSKSTSVGLFSLVDNDSVVVAMLAIVFCTIWLFRKRRLTLRQR